MRRVEDLEAEKQILQAELTGTKQLQSVMLEKIRGDMASQMRSRIEIEVSDKITS
jgi:hypothetical protein